MSTEPAKHTPTEEPPLLTDAQIGTLALLTVYEGDMTIPYREYWVKNIGIPFARAVESATRAAIKKATGEAA